MVEERSNSRAPNLEPFTAQMVLFGQSCRMTMDDRFAISRDRAAVIPVNSTIASVLAYFIRTASDFSPGMVFLVDAPENGLWIKITRSHCNAPVELTRRFRNDI